MQTHSSFCAPYPGRPPVPQPPPLSQCHCPFCPGSFGLCPKTTSMLTSNAIHLCSGVQPTSACPVPSNLYLCPQPQPGVQIFFCDSWMVPFPPCILEALLFTSPPTRLPPLCSLAHSLHFGPSSHPAWDPEVTFFSFGFLILSCPRSDIVL